MPCVLIGSVKHAMCADWICLHAVWADWICHTCHVGLLDLSDMPCGLIGSVSHAVWVDWICQSCHMGLLLIFPVPYDSFSLHDSWLYSNLHENHLHQHVVPPHTDVGYSCSQNETRLV